MCRLRLVSTKRTAAISTIARMINAVPVTRLPGA